ADGVVAGSQDRRGDRVTPGGTHPLLRHVDRVRGLHGALHPYGPRAARRDGHVCPGLVLELTAPPAKTPKRLANAEERANVKLQRRYPMNTITSKDGVQIYFKDWGPRHAQSLVFHHGWPLSADDWDSQMLYFVGKGYRVVAHDRRRHGRSSQVSDGHD